jgi:hypothetical protein
MPSTAKYSIPYPALTDTPDVPYWLQQQAQQADATMQTLVKAQFSDATFPASAAAITAETVIDRISIAAVPYTRRILLDANAYVTVSVANTVANVILYAGAVAVGYGRRNIAGASLADEIVATGHVDLAADTALVIELRVSRFSGTGTITTSNSSSLTNTNVLMVRT